MGLEVGKIVGDDVGDGRRCQELLLCILTRSMIDFQVQEVSPSLSVP